VFGDVAELYDRARPPYPPELVDAVVQFARLDADRPVLEVGAGTGKATVLFAVRGLEVAAIEPSPAMAAVARRACAGFRRVQIEEVEFERFELPERRFAAVISAQAWHWIRPEVKYVKARAALERGGALAVFWNRPRWSEMPIRDELRQAYASAAPEFTVKQGPMHPAGEKMPELWGNWHAEIERTAGFDAAEIRHYDWSQEYTTEQYCALLRTHSDHILLGEGRLATLLDAIAAVLDRNGGRLAYRYSTRLCLARAY
jgi:SAM-dependent methyltransferase